MGNAEDSLTAADNELMRAKRALAPHYDETFGPMLEDVSVGYMAELAAKRLVGLDAETDRLRALLEDVYDARVILELYGVHPNTTLAVGIIQALARAAYAEAHGQPPSVDAVGQPPHDPT